MDNLELYNALRTPPEEALKEIRGGRMSGKTDINPMWRIKALTEQFGPCGIGWKYEVTRQWTEPGSNGEISAFCNIDLYYKYGDAWSAAIPGTGGSAFVAKEKNGLYTSDECYKMALTDAISVAAKALGVAGDIYWGKDPTKYSRPGNGSESPQKALTCADCGQIIKGVKGKDGKIRTPLQIEEYSLQTYGRTLCISCQKKAKEARNAGQAG